MYYYIYDTFVADKKYDRLIAQIETRLTDLGMTGKIGRLGAFTNAKGLIRDEYRRGVETIVVVGNDETIAKVVDGIGDAKVTLGIIPVGSPASIAKSLGIPEGIEACDVLSKRVTQKIDLGSVNGHLFLSHVHIPGGEIIVDIGSYRISPIAEECEIIVSNLGGGEMTDKDGRSFSDPMDGLLNAFITPKTAQSFWSSFRKKENNISSVIPLRKISVTSEEPISVMADGRQITHKEFSIEIVPERLKIITGRERVFA